MKKYSIIFLMIVLGAVFGTVYNYLYYPHKLAEFAEAITIGIVIGALLGFIEEFALRKTFQSLRLYKVMLIRALLYSVITSLILSLVLSVEITFVREVSYGNALLIYLRSPDFIRDFFFTLSFIFIMIFVSQIFQLIGTKNMLRLFAGQYHQPKEVTRIFMFIDLNDSTPIAESLGNEKYSDFIAEYFNDVSDAVSLHHGEIYQYVGDEATIVWPLVGKNRQWAKCFFNLHSIIKSRTKEYISTYGYVPQFKAGAHFGRVLLTEVGKQKKELVYHGDVVNTTARIISKCNELNETLLISEDLSEIAELQEYECQPYTEIELKGKAHRINLFGIRKS